MGLDCGLSGDAVRGTVVRLRSTFSRPSSRVTVICGVALILAFAVAGFVVPLDPDFDGTFGLEAYRRFGPPVWAGASVLLLAVLLSDRLARRIERGAASAFRRVPRASGVALLVVGLTSAYFLLTDRSLSGDASGSVLNACRGQVAPSNALTGLLQVALVAALDVDPWLILRTLSCVAGACFVLTAVWTAESLFEHRSDRVSVVFLLVASGSATLFFGNIEMYAPLVAGLLLYLALALRCMSGATQLRWPALALGLAATLHGSALVLLPSLGYVAWCSPAAQRNVRRLAATTVAFLAPIAVTGAVMYFVLWDGTLPTGQTERFGNALGAAGQGPFLPWTLTPSNVNHRYALLDAEHVVGVLNVAFFACPVGLLLSLLGGRWSARARFLLLASSSLIGLALVWNVSYPLRRDWDLFATIGVALALLGAVRVLGSEVLPGRAARVAALCLYTFLPVVVSNTGDRVQRRAYANSMSWAYDRALLPESPISERVRPRVERSLARWRDATTRLDPDGVARRMSVAWDAVRASDHATALRLTDEVLALEPDHFEATLARGEVLFDQRRAAEARTTLERALVVAPEHMRPQARRFLAQIELDQRRFEEAAQQLERGLREEMAWPSEALSLLEMLIAVRRAQGMDGVAAALESMAERRRSTGLK